MLIANVFVVHETTSLYELDKLIPYFSGLSDHCISIYLFGFTKFGYLSNICIGGVILDKKKIESVYFTIHISSNSQLHLILVFQNLCGGYIYHP